MKIKVHDEHGPLESYVVVDTSRATRVWEPARDWDGRNWIYRSTGSEWEWETLYRSRRGRYYIVERSAWQGTRPTARFVSPQQAAAWLILNDYELPEELVEHDPTE
ncbi:MAG: hypothetical protein J7601_10840 [Chloroflexi bacterium]|jgi:hypothetical protein|nr:hypothetical protein [Chloroflexota bacterium]